MEFFSPLLLIIDYLLMIILLMMLSFFKLCSLSIGLGIGGFIAKPRQQRGPPKLVVQGPHTADGQPPILLTAEVPAGASTGDSDAAAMLDSNEVAAKKKPRKLRKRGIIEDTYPVYLQVHNTLLLVKLFMCACLLSTCTAHIA